MPVSNHRSPSPALLTRAVAAVAIASTLAMTGCASIGLRFLTPYRPEIQQGNFVSSEMMSQLREGMTRDQVKFTLGTPMGTSVFRSDRWDYVFYLKRPTGEVTERKLAVWFKDDKLAHWLGDPMPSERPSVEAAKLADPATPVVPPVTPVPAAVPSVPPAPPTS